ncbi:MAG: diacylglycerol kinase family protein [Verrucomicrobiota bacterium]
MSIRFIVNPNSGHNRKRPWLARTIERFMLKQRVEGDLRVTEAPEHATVLAREAVALGADRVVAVGGDGTLNEVARALVHTKTLLGLVPCGSGNGLALHLGLPLDFEAALHLSAAKEGQADLIDSGEANGHFFFNVMGLGLDAEVSRRFNQLQKRGFVAYARTAWTALQEHKSESVVFYSSEREADKRREDVCLLSIANSDQYGNNARIAPGASVKDGVLDLVAMPCSSLGEAFMLSARLFLGTLNAAPRVTILRGTAFWIERQKEGIIHTDGEPHHTGSRIEVRVHPGSLGVWRGG